MISLLAITGRPSVLRPLSVLVASVSAGALLRYVSEMTEHQTRAICERCGLPFVEVDACGEQLRGCPGCNQWKAVASDEWRRLPDEDIAALPGMGTTWRRPIGV